MIKFNVCSASMENLPEDLTKVLLEASCRISKISIIVLTHVNKLWYRMARRYAKQNKISRNLKHYEIAAEGSLEVLKWAKSYDCCSDLWTCAYAAKYGHLEVLKWARSNGYEWSSWTCTYAAQNGHLEILKWAISNGCRCDPNTRKLAQQKWPNESF
jgi:hypothetical protein